MKKKKTDENLGQLLAIAELIAEDYRFRHSYLFVLNKLFMEERKRYEAAYTFHANKIADLSEKLGLRIVCFDGQEYNEGLPISPLNADEFGVDDTLIVQQTIEPTILTNSGNPLKTGTVMLARKTVTQTMLNSDEVFIALFYSIAQTPEEFSNPTLYRQLVNQGMRCIEDSDINGLKDIIGRLLQIRLPKENSKLDDIIKQSGITK